MRVVHLINATPDGRCDHRQVIADDALHHHAAATLQGADMIVMGAGTYNLLAPHWSAVARDRSGTDAENEFARALTDIPKIVFSRSASPLDGWNAQVDDGDPVARLRQLRASGTSKVVVQASPALAKTLRKAGLIDEFRLLLQPMLGGRGPTLFDEDDTTELNLMGSSPTSSGAVALDYSLRYGPDVGPSQLPPT